MNSLCDFACDQCGESATRPEQELDRIVDHSGQQVNLCVNCEQTEAKNQQNGALSKYFHLAQPDIEFILIDKRTGKRI